MFPKISIVLPVLNGKETIEKAIRSVIDQHYQNLELIIMDGGSTDGTIDVIKTYSHHISYFQSKPDGNPALAYNAGIEKASGDLVAILMADDWYQPGLFAKIAEAFVKRPDADMFSCAGRIVYYDEKKQCYRTHLSYTKAEQLHLSFYNIFFVVSVICCRFIKKSLYDRLGLYHPFNMSGKYILSNDKEFLMRAVMNGAKNIFVDYVGHHYLAHKGSSTFGHHKINIMKLCKEHMEIAEIYLQKSELTKKDRLLLHYWYNDQSARLLLYKLLEGDLRAVLTVAGDGFKKYTLFWPTAFFVTIFRIVVKKAKRWWLQLSS